MLHAYDNSPETAARKQVEANITGQAINLRDLEQAASNARTFSAALARDGRVHESAFWARMHARAAEAVAEATAGADARRERIIYQDLLRARMLDLRVAVDSDDGLSSAKPDNNTSRNLRRSIVDAR